MKMTLAITIASLGLAALALIGITLGLTPGSLLLLSAAGYVTFRRKPAAA